MALPYYTMNYCVQEYQFQTKNHIKQKIKFSITLHAWIILFKSVFLKESKFNNMRNTRGQYWFANNDLVRIIKQIICKYRKYFLQLHNFWYINW